MAGIPNRKVRQRSVDRPATVGDVSPMRVRRYQRTAKNAPGIEGGDRPASLSGKRGDDKWDDL